MNIDEIIKDLPRKPHSPLDCIVSMVMKVLLTASIALCTFISLEFAKYLGYTDAFVQILIIAVYHIAFFKYVLFLEKEKNKVDFISIL